MSDVYKTYRNNSGETLKIVYAENCDSPLEDSDRLFNLLPVSLPPLR